MKKREKRGAWFRELDAKARAKLLTDLSATERDAAARWHWELWARDGQLAPAGDWRVWLIMAGRGFGKTRAGAEWVRQLARQSARMLWRAPSTNTS